MPCRNVIKEYKAEGTYHIYNRGVEKRLIFLEKVDEDIFYNYLSLAAGRNNIQIVKYSLMPNHFHFLIKQLNERDIEHFMRSLCTRYSCYFNFKYQRVGGLFQGPYRARLIDSDWDMGIIEEYVNNQ